MTVLVTDTEHTRAQGPHRVLIITGDPLGQKLAGPAIRATAFAKVLAGDGHHVRVVSLQSSTLESDLFESATAKTNTEMQVHEAWADIIIVQGNALVLFECLASTLKYLVVDVYDPMHLEQLEQGRELGEADWNNSILGANAILNDQLTKGDFFLAASTRQLHLWIGALASLGRINSKTYQQDETLNKLIGVVPFGLEPEIPGTHKPALRNVVPGITDDSKILIWAGGIYNWFDPESLVRAVGEVAMTHPEVVLFFMGTKHPHPGVPEMEVIARTRGLSAELGLTDKHVFFNSSWVDYEDRHNYLREADAGVSTHFEHIETVFSFRTRILDYLWAGLPIISTRGDTFGDLVEHAGLGASVPERDVSALVSAITRTLFDDAASLTARANVQEAREQFFWANACAPLREFCASPYYAADRIMYAEDGTRSRPTIQLHQKRLTSRRIKRGLQVLFTQGPFAVIRAFKR